MDYLILALSTWRISSLLTNQSERGPFAVLDRLHSWAGNNNSEVAQALSCLWCASIWVGLVVTTAYYFAPEIVRWILLPFALSAMAIAVDRMVG